MSKADNIAGFDTYTPGSGNKTHYIDNVMVAIGAVKPKVIEKKPAPSAPVSTPAPTGVPVVKDFKSALITNLQVFSPTTPWVINPGIQVGARQYVDRSFYIAKMPDAYAGCEWIQTACDSKNYFKDPLATFRLTAEAEVYVAFDDRVVSKPGWFSEWVDTGDDIVNTEANPTTFSIFARRFPAGDVELGQNGQSSGATHYMVFVKGPNWKPGQTTGASANVPVIVTWKSILSLRPDWYGSDEAIRIADNILSYQYETGGWYKNIDMTEKLSPADRKIIEANKGSKSESTIDNGATTTQIRYLAKVYTATKKEQYKQAFLKGMKFLFDAQYPNGGWPQYYPEHTIDYYKRITFNDNAMNEVLRLLQSIFKEDPDFKFVDPEMRLKAKQAFDKGIDCILKSQVRVNGKLTVWCAQHNEITLAPADARAYEKASLCSAESAGLVRLLMSIDNPSPQVIRTIQSAMAWFNDVQLQGMEVKQKPDPKLEKGFDMVVLDNPAAPPLWARFYEIGTNRPIFCGRDGMIKYNLAEIEHERRIGYSWFNFSGGSLMKVDYPAWLKKCGISENVLNK
jgi:PelA/Pel-15E family pectate lyase